MSLILSPSINLFGLVACFDPASVGKGLPEDKNLLDLSGWALGPASAPGFNRIGTDDESERIFAPDPWGPDNIVWETRPNGSDNADGGFNTAFVTVDRTKMYRFSVWVNNKIEGVDGRFYFGTEGRNSSFSDTGVLQRDIGGVTTNPYFWFSNNPPGSSLPLDTWVLVVGHVWPEGSGTGDDHPESGRYTISGGKFGDLNRDYVWNTDTEFTQERVYTYYSTTTVPRQHFIYPRIDLVDGTEPSIQELLDGYPSRMKNLVNQDDDFGPLLTADPTYSPSEKSLTFNGVNQIATFPTRFNLSSSLPYTVDIWFKMNQMPSTTTGSHSKVFGGNIGSHFSICLSPVVAGSTARINMRLDDSGEQNVTNHILSQNEWVNFTAVGVSDSSLLSQKITLYVNGALDKPQATTSDAGWGFRTAQRIGYDDRRLTFSNISVGQIKIYNRELTPEEIHNNFNALRGRYRV